MTENTPRKKPGISSFSKNYWIVILMEFFERGSYYGMMSILSVYMTDQLSFSKESVGVIKSTIQPLVIYSSYSIRSNWRKIWLQKNIDLRIYLFGSRLFFNKPDN